MCRYVLAFVLDYQSAFKQSPVEPWTAAHGHAKLPRQRNDLYFADCTFVQNMYPNMVHGVILSIKGIGCLGSAVCEDGVRGLAMRSSVSFWENNRENPKP